MLSRDLNSEVDIVVDETTSRTTYMYVCIIPPMATYPRKDDGAA